MSTATAKDNNNERRLQLQGLALLNGAIRSRGYTTQTYAQAGYDQFVVVVDRTYDKGTQKALEIAVKLAGAEAIVDYQGSNSPATPPGSMGVFHVCLKTLKDTQKVEAAIASNKDDIAKAVSGKAY